MNLIAELLTGVLQFITAEMSTLRKAVFRLAWAAAFALLAALLLFAGAAAVLWATYRYLADQFGPSAAGLAIGAAAFLLAAVAGKIAGMNAR